MKRRIYAAVNADIDRDGLKSAIRALFDDIARKHNISGYTIQSLHLDKTGVRNPKCTCTIYYELEGYLYRWKGTPNIKLGVPVGVEIPEDYYLDNPEIEDDIMEYISEVSELDALDAQVEDTFEYVKKSAEDLARQYRITVECSRYPKKLEPGRFRYCDIDVKVVDVDTKYTTNLGGMENHFLRIQSGKYQASLYTAIVDISGSFPEKFSKQTIDEKLERGFKKFDSELRDAEMKLDSAQDMEAHADELLQLIKNLCKSSGCLLEYKDFQYDEYADVDRIGNIRCRIEYNNRVSKFNLANYMNDSTAKVKKAIQSRIRRLKNPDTKPESQKHEQEDLDW